MNFHASTNGNSVAFLRDGPIFGFNGRGREIFRSQNHDSPAHSGCPHARSRADEGQDWASFETCRIFFCASEL